MKITNLKKLIKDAKKLADNLELAYGVRQCMICGAEPEKQAQMIIETINNLKQKIKGGDN